MRLMVDNTLRLQIDIEPRYAADAMSLFGRVGQEVAIAAMLPEHQRPAPDKPSTGPGPRAREAIAMCTDPKFQEWCFCVHREHCGPSGGVEGAKAVILALCEVGSRKELDELEASWSLFLDKVRSPFLRWSRTGGGQRAGT